jgi:hypothetical protein
LLAIVALIVIVILNQTISIWHIAANVIEVSVVKRVSKDDVVGNSLDSFLWLANIIESL